MDLGAQLPHGALRVFVMGERAARLEEATPEEVARMRVLTAEAMRDGALGFSTSRTLNHRTVKGDPTPSLRASEAELLGIALGMKDAGRGVIEFISDFNTPSPESEFEMIERLLAASGRPFSVSLAQAHSRPEGWRRLLGLVEGLVAKGHAAKAQVAPRPIGVLQGLQASRTPFSMCRSYKDIQNKSVGERLAIMRDPAFRAKLLEEAHEPLRSDMAARLTDYDRMFPLGDPPDYEPAQESSLGARARREGRDPREVVYDYLIEGEGKNFIFAPFANYRRLQSRLLQRDDAEPAHADRAGRRRRACRPDLRRLVPDLSPVALGPRPRLGQARRVVAGQAPHARTMPARSASTIAASWRRATRPISTSSTSTSSASRRR